MTSFNFRIPGSLDAACVLSAEGPRGPPRRVPRAACRRVARCSTLSATGWRDFSTSCAEDGLLVGYVETEDFAAAQAGMEATDINARWQAEMAPFFESLDGARPDEAMKPLTEVFHLA